MEIDEKLKKVHFNNNVKYLCEEIKLAPQFQSVELSEEALLKRINKNGILIEIKVEKETLLSVALKALIYVKKSLTVSKELSKSQKLKDLIKSLKERIAPTSDKIILAPFMVPCLVWSSNGWRTWDFIEGEYSKQTDDYLLYTAHFKNVQEHVDDGAMIDCIAAYQTEHGMFLDSNRDDFYQFKREDSGRTCEFQSK